MSTVVQLPTGKALTVRAAVDVFLDSLGNPNTVRNYGIGVGKTADRIGEGRPLASVADDEIGEALELLWGTSAVNTWNSRRAAVLSWLGWCRERGYDGLRPARAWPLTGWSRGVRCTCGRRRCGGCSTRPPGARSRSWA